VEADIQGLMDIHDVILHVGRTALRAHYLITCSAAAGARASRRRAAMRAPRASLPRRYRGIPLTEGAAASSIGPGRRCRGRLHDREVAFPLEVRSPAFARVAMRPKMRSMQPAMSFWRHLCGALLLSVARRVRRCRADRHRHPGHEALRRAAHAAVGDPGCRALSARVCAGTNDGQAWRDRMEG
jgi:hypothetical protein